MREVDNVPGTEILIEEEIPDQGYILELPLFPGLKIRSIRGIAAFISDDVKFNALEIYGVKFNRNIRMRCGNGKRVLVVKNNMVTLFYSSELGFRVGDDVLCP